MRKKKSGNSRRQYNDELKAEAGRMLLDGHSPKSVASHLGFSSMKILYRWKARMVPESGPAATAVDPLKLHFAHIEQTANPKKLLAFYRRCLGSPYEYGDDSYVWLASLEDGTTAGNKVSADVIIRRVEEGVSLNDDERLTVDILWIEARDPAAKR